MEGKKILIIEDEQELRDALTTVLTNAGLLALNAEDGEEGITRALADHPDLILLDLGLPKMSGHQVLSKLRRDAWGKNVHVLILTNADDAANIALGVEEKGSEYIIKSQTSLEDIVKKVKQHLLGYYDRH